MLTQALDLDFAVNGCAVLPHVLNKEAVIRIIQIIDRHYPPGTEPHATRAALKTIPDLMEEFLGNENLKLLLKDFFPQGYTLTKSIYFDKPHRANWIVNWHQDTTLNLSDKIETPGFGNWLHKNGFYSVQPPVAYLEQTLTLRIHLDDTDDTNGALKVIPGSHRKGFISETELKQILQNDAPVTVPVPAGGLMLMRPLLLHASSRAAGGRRRRVLHLEFCEKSLPEGLEWAEVLSEPQIFRI